MSNVIRHSTVTAILAIGLLASGCASLRDKEPVAASSQEDRVAMCGKCETVWVDRPYRPGKSTMVYHRKEAKMVCPDCQSAVENFVKTGKFAHTCKTCGDNLALCPVCR